MNLLSKSKTTCIIGAGPSGLTSIKICLEYGIIPICYEKSDGICGLWNYQYEKLLNKATVMESTVVNSTKEMYSFSDFPAPENWPNYTHNKLVKQYLHMYAECFDLIKHIRFKKTVIKVEKSHDYETTGQWVVVLDDGEEKIFDGILVCTGHHADPYIPRFEGCDQFLGRIVHSQVYKNWREFKNQKILVVGLGNSAIDIATELSDFCSKVYLSTRRGGWIWPRLWRKGIPTEAWYTSRWRFKVVRHLFPWPLINGHIQHMMNKLIDYRRFSMLPEHCVLSQHPIVNDRLPTCLAQGSVILKPDVEKFSKTSVTFSDGSECEIDAAIVCTGYTFGFPFLQKTIVPVENNQVRLYKHVFPPHLKHPSLAVIGVLQPNAPLFPLMELQARWFASLMIGQCRLPSVDVMQEVVEKNLKKLSKQYFRSIRHTIQADWLDYVDELSEAIGAKPNFLKMFFTDPKLWFVCFFRPYTPFVLRLNDPKTYSEARNLVLTSYDRVKNASKTRKCEPSKSYQWAAPFVKIILMIISAVIIVNLLLQIRLHESTNLFLIYIYAFVVVFYFVMCCLVHIVVDSMFDSWPVIS